MPFVRAFGSSRRGKDQTAPGRMRIKPLEPGRRAWSQWADDSGREAGLAHDSACPRVPEAVRPEQLNSTYAVSLQTMMFAAAEPMKDRKRILANVEFSSSTRSSSASGRPGRGPGTMACRCARRQLEHSIRPARVECRQGGRSDDPPRGLDAFAHLFRGDTKSRRRLGICAPPSVDRKHDLRGNLQPDPDRARDGTRVSSTFRREINDCGKGGYNPNWIRASIG